MTGAKADNLLTVTRSIRIPRDEFQMEFIRSSGPGGQNVNKVASKVRLRWPVVRSPSLPEAVKERFLQKYRRRITADGGLLITSQRFRDQSKNIDDCFEKLRAMLLEVARPLKRRQKSRPPKAAKEKRLAEKRRRSERKQRRKRPQPEE